MKTILVTGSKGQLGSELQYLSPVFPQFRFVFTDVDELDITDEKKLDNYLSSICPDILINCAAYTAVDKAESDQENARRINALAPGLIGKLAKKHNFRVIHTSTDYVFDGSSSIPLKEDDFTNPVSVYGVTKLDGEKALLVENPDAIIIRTAWLYSVYGNNFVKTMIRLGNEREQLGVVSDQVGSPTNAEDLALAILQIIEFSFLHRWNPGIYHYSNEGVCSWYEFALEIHRMAGVNCFVKPIATSEYPTAAKRPEYSLLDKTKIKNTFGIEISGWKESLEKCIKRIDPIR
ncbi:MAG: dTDP-4-dehydrorhamnose reductase [Bacteroidetes bacterium GWF2_38_335]|nr:MAG: dTDP-4-dehydrorhamnose reductase [Bacteroidetes bacterium GWF2_38_335]OFY79030.1 MAG: dTDP-4-dehydrorhamnose reductase [Bacteroidetes bacterium RIFOXYA12_FULL_38_20]HBS86110.1 dTDP-4-dehydrorhamnose reductase [Bacteroidales bacterium]